MAEAPQAKVKVNLTQTFSSQKEQWDISTEKNMRMYKNCNTQERTHRTQKEKFSLLYFFFKNAYKICLTEGEKEQQRIKKFTGLYLVAFPLYLSRVVGQTE